MDACLRSVAFALPGGNFSRDPVLAIQATVQALTAETAAVSASA